MSYTILEHCPDHRLHHSDLQRRRDVFVLPDGSQFDVRSFGRQDVWATDVWATIFFPNVHLGDTKTRASFGAHCENLNEDRSILSATKM